MNLSPEAVCQRALLRYKGPLYPRQLAERNGLLRGWCPFYLMPQGAWFERRDHRGWGLPDDVRWCRVQEAWAGGYYPDDYLWVDSWKPSGELLQVGEPWLAFSSSRPVIVAPPWWPEEAA